MNKISSTNKVYKTFIIYVWIITIGVIILNIIALPKYVPFWAFTAKEVLLLLFYLFVVAVFIERAVEVFIHVWRDAGEQEKLTGIKILRLPQEKRPRALTTEDKTVPETIAEAVQAHEEYSAETGKRAMPLTFVLGLLISVVGIRAVQPLVDPAFFSRTLTVTQQTLFTVMYVLVTGALLGGGSKGIHQIMELIIKVAEKYINEIRFVSISKLIIRSCYDL